MSGIIALVNRDDRPVEESVLAALERSAAHRAVDGHRSWREGPVGLAHQHFRVWRQGDETSQPLRAAESGLVLTCDARLDGRGELGRALGLEPRDAVSDPQLILRAYQRWGPECVEHLRGDFAFALWDASARRLFCARDALGVRDLAYFVSATHFVAASEVATVLAHPGVSERLDEGRLAEYLAGHWGEHHESFFEGVFYCPPAHSLLVGGSSFRLWRYWDLDQTRRVVHRREEDYVEEFRGLLTAAVHDRLGATAPVAVSLSGGPDSGALAALAAGADPSARVRSLSYVFDRLTSCDERRYIQTIADRHRLDATFIVGDELWPLRDPATWPVFPDFPGQDPYVRLPMAIADAAREMGSRVILNGHYSDLLFHGGQYFAADLWSPQRIPQVASILAANRASVAWKRDVLRNGLWMGAPLRLRAAVRRLRGAKGLPGPRGMLEAGFVSRVRLDERLERMGERVDGERADLQARWRHLTMSILAQGAAAARRLYNRRATELVDPYWDRTLVEYVSAIPAHLLARPGTTKYLLRRATIGMVPDAVRERRDKTSLYELFCEGLLSRERETVLGTFAEPQLVARGMVRGAWLDTELAAGRGWFDFGHALWRCLCVELWLRNRDARQAPAGAGTQRN